MPAKSDEMMVAKETFVTEDGVSYYKDTTRVRAGDVPKKFKDLFKPLDVSYPTVEAATAAPGETRGAEVTAAPAEPESEAGPTKGLTTASLKGG